MTSKTTRWHKTVYPYHQDLQGHWWTVNPQKGLVAVPLNGRCLLATLDAAGFYLLGDVLMPKSAAA